MCEKCNGNLWIPHHVEYANGTFYEYVERCSCADKTTTEKNLKSKGITNFDAKFSDFETFNEGELSNAKKKGYEYVKNFKKNENARCNSFFICGKSGTGKTQLTSIMVNVLKDNGVIIKQLGYRDDIEPLKNLKVVDHLAYETKMNGYKNCRLLWIDDLAKGGVTQADVNLLYEIINYRYVNQKPMIITSEYNPMKLAEVDEAISGRIYQMSKDNIVVLENTKNYRFR